MYRILNILTTRDFHVLERDETLFDRLLHCVAMERSMFHLVTGGNGFANFRERDRFFHRRRYNATHYFEPNPFALGEGVFVYWLEVRVRQSAIES